ncbi:hypothetical protein HPP92_022615 [Vanilla planifolia]|uniref:Uncharacterized protein n=1 Tax=Vanilla planifolia TaxID=51239 RepID=A0A835UF92_VANPL|nr:hypothetical protein HPP92_022899 [Vanilla planifolia]KAG0459487.1 hypothetical protein HPP92_022615 [Vanilla planifolia]
MAASSVESRLLIIAVIAVANIIGSTAATAAPAPAPASSANSLSSPLVAVFVSSLVAFLVGCLHH